MTKRTDDEHKTFRFKVSYLSSVYRTIEVNGEENLCELAETIIESFDFVLDNPWGFYNFTENNQNQIKECYESASKKNGIYEVEAQLIKNVFFPGKKMLFLFDYDRQWQFIVECIETTSFRAFKMSSRELEDLREGKAPIQYPLFSED